MLLGFLKYQVFRLGLWDIGTKCRGLSGEVDYSVYVEPCKCNPNSSKIQRQDWGPTIGGAMASLYA